MHAFIQYTFIQYTIQFIQYNTIYTIQYLPCKSTFLLSCMAKVKLRYYPLLYTVGLVLTMSDVLQNAMEYRSYIWSENLYFAQANKCVLTCL